MEATQREELARRLTAYLRTSLLGDPRAPLELDTPLVSSGLIDSFDLVELLSAVERISGLSLPAGRVSPQDLETIGRILELVERFGGA